MSWFTGVAVYILTWWVTLFMILPLWVTPSEPGELGHAAGAPKLPYLGRKLALNTLVAAIFWLGIYILLKQPWIGFRGSS
jgi:predicted secreted protein